MNIKQYLHCDFIIDGNKLIFFSYDNFLLEFNLDNHRIQFSEFADASICGKVAYRDSIEKLIKIREILVAISISGEKVYFYNVETKHWKAVEIECNRYRYDNYIDILYDNKFIYVIPKCRPYILKIDIQKQCIDKIEAPFLLQLSKFRTIVCLKSKCLYFFESQSKRILIFNIDTRKYMEPEVESTLGSVASVQYKEGCFLILSCDGHLVKWTEGSCRLEMIIDPVENFGGNYFLEFVVTEKNIWLLPMLGEHIYVYGIQGKMLKKYSGYPQDFSYIASNGRYKYLRGHEYENSVYFGMHSASHFLIINKETGIAEWIKPIFPTEEEEYLFRVKYGLDPAENEGTVSVEMFLKTIIHLGSYLQDENRCEGIKVKSSIGKMIYTEMDKV